MTATEPDGHDQRLMRSPALCSPWRRSTQRSSWWWMRLTSVRYLTAAETASYRASSASRKRPRQTSSRPHVCLIPEITGRFGRSPTLEIRATEGDIQRYLDGHMSHLPGFVRRDSSLQADIKTAIAKAVNGMRVEITLVYFLSRRALSSDVSSGSYLLSFISTR